MGGLYSSPIKSEKEFLDGNSKKCFILYARNLRILLGDDKRFWQWRRDQKPVSDDEANEVVAELLDSYWLEVHGKFEAAKLSPGTEYEVVFNVQLTPSAYGWENPVYLRLTRPDGRNEERQENLMAKPRGEWFEIPVGKYETSTTNTGAGEIKILIYKTGGAWKSGLVIKSITIRPKKC